MSASEERLLSLEEVADRLQVSDQSVRRWIKAGRLKAYKPGLEWRIAPEDLDEFLEARSSPKASASESPGQLDEQEYRKALGEFILGLLQDTASSQPIEEQSDRDIAAFKQGQPGEVLAYFQEEESPERQELVEEAARVLVEEYQRALEAGQRNK